MELNMNVADLLISFNWMWQGMLALFVCMGFIALATVLINKIFKPREKKDV
jgi:hypothetical protein